MELEKTINFEVYHVLNEGNIHLGLDHTASIKSHVQVLCEALQDDRMYEELLKQEMLRLWKSKYSPTLNWSFLSASTEYGYVNSFKNSLKGFLGKKADLKDFYAFMKNDSDRNLIIRCLKKMYNYK